MGTKRKSDEEKSESGKVSQGRALFDAYNELVLEVFRLNGALIESGDRLTKDLHLTSARWQVLGAIILSPVPLPVAHIARNMGLARQSVQRSVDELKRLDMVRLEENPHHRRAMLVIATDQGKRAFFTALDRQDRWMNYINPGLPVEEIASASSVLRLFRNRLEAAGSPDSVLHGEEFQIPAAVPEGDQHDSE